MFVDKVRPVWIGLSKLSPEQRSRTRMLKQIERQIRKLKRGGKGPGRSWFREIGHQAYFIPRFANENLAEIITRGKANAFPIQNTPLKCLTGLREDVLRGELDAVLVEISQKRAKRFAKRRVKPRKKKMLVRRRRARAKPTPPPPAPTETVAPKTERVASK